MKKEDFIKKYGQEAWEKKLLQTKQWISEHKDRKREIAREWRNKNKERSNATTKKWQDEHRDKVLEIQRRWYKNNKEKSAEQFQKYYSTRKGRAAHLIASYNSADVDGCNLTRDWILQNIFNSSCIYCGDSDWRHLGCDRIDNDKPHTMDNCVCSCAVCNIERWYKRMSVGEFIEYRKTHPRELRQEEPPKMNIVEENGIKVIKKAIL